MSAGIACTFSISAQNTAPREIHYPDGSLYKECYSVRATKPLREIIADRKAKGLDKLVAKDGPMPDGEIRNEFTRNKPKRAPVSFSSNSDVQSVQGHMIGATIQNFEGQPCYGGYPLDPNGMIGTTYFVQTINSSIAAWDKTGNVYIPQTSLDAALFGKVGEADLGDPVTIYDKIADRWIITELEGLLSNSNIDTLLFAVSQTNDPAGAYWIYTFDPDNSNVDDYPKYAVWSNGYYMTCNCQNNDYVIAYQRDSMLVGKKAAYIAMPWNYGPQISGCTGNFFCPMMLDCDGVLPPANSPEYLFYYWEQDWGCGGGADSIIIEQVNVNWGTKKGTINAKFQHLVVNNFNSNFLADFDQNLPQPGNNTTNYLASSDGFFGYRIPYLRWASYNSAVMQFPVNNGTLNAPIAAIEWFELRQDTTTKLWSIYQQSTYAPNDGVSRWNPAIAMDQNASIAIEYTVSDPKTVYPGLRYTGRRVCDALNTMTVTEVTAVNGNAIANTPQGSGNRWGDYSHLSVDPIDGVTFWATNMYANSSFTNSNIGTRITNFQITKCVTGVDGVNPAAAAVVAYQNGSSLIVKGTDFPENENLTVQLFDENGRSLMAKQMVSNSKTMETSFNVSGLAKALYIIRIGNDHIQRVIKTTIN